MEGISALALSLHTLLDSCLPIVVMASRKVPHAGWVFCLPDPEGLDRNLIVNTFTGETCYVPAATKLAFNEQGWAYLHSAGPTVWLKESSGN